MSFYVNQPSLGARIGTGLAQGFSQQIPKEIEHYRLSKGLQNFANQAENMNPVQQYLNLASIYGAAKNPQLLQSFADLARMQNYAQATQRLGQGYPGQPEGMSQNGMPIPEQAGMEAPQNKSLQGINNLQQAQNQLSRISQIGQTKPVPREQIQVPQITPESGIGEKFKTRNIFTPEQKAYWENYYASFGYLPEAARKKADELENRYLNEPEVNRKNLEYLEDRQAKAEDKLKTYIEKKLQKKGEALYTDLTGDMLVNLNRGMGRDLIENPNKSIDDVAQDWSEKGKRLAQAKNQLNRIAQTTGLETLVRGNKTFNDLRSAQKVFEETDNLEEFKNILQSEFGLSPQGSSFVSFPLRPELKKFIDKNVNITRKPENLEKNSQMLAQKITPLLDKDDSLLSIAWRLSQIDPWFDQTAFFENIDYKKLNPRQQQELIQGSAGILPYWSDIKYLPWEKEK